MNASGDLDPVVIAARLVLLDALEALGHHDHRFAAFGQLDDTLFKVVVE